MLADQRMREQRLPRRRAVPASRPPAPRAARTRRRAGRARAARARAAAGGAATGRRGRRAPAPRRRRRRRGPASVPPLRTSTTCTSSSPEASEATRPRRGLAVERAAALLEQRRLLGQPRVAVELEQLALDLGDPGSARHAVELLGEDHVVGVEVAQVVARGSRRARRSSRRGQADVGGELVAVLGRGAPAARPRRRPSTARTQVRWLRPTWSTATRSGATPSSRANERWKPIATLQSPTARWPASSSARVTIPTGFVKSTIHAPSAASSRTRSAISSTTGTVRIAFAKPPAPVVSWPMQPQASGIVSSESRAAWPPTRIWIEHEVGAVERPVELAGHRERSRRSPGASSIRRASPPTTSRRSRVDVVQHELAHVDPLALAREPRHELGRVRRPAADHRDLHPFTPVSVTPSTKARWARKNSDDHRRHHEQRRRHRQVPLHLVQRAELRQPDRSDPVVGVLADVQQRQEEVVPGVENREQRHRGDRRLREPQHDGRQDAELAAAVDARRVEVLLGDREEELAQQEDRERVAEPVRDDQRPERADRGASFAHIT